MNVHFLNPIERTIVSKFIALLAIATQQTDLIFAGTAVSAELFRPALTDVIGVYRNSRIVVFYRRKQYQRKITPAK